MNIFHLDKCPQKSIEYHCDKHVVKMILEYAQMLSTAHHILSSLVPDGMYRKTHQNHPCSKWVRQTSGNYTYLLEYLRLALDEYTFRYGKIHKTSEKLPLLMCVPNLIDTSMEVTDAPKCMPDEYKVDSVIQSYRNYYIGDKKSFATYKNRNDPHRFPALIH